MAAPTSFANGGTTIGGTDLQTLLQKLQKTATEERKGMVVGAVSGISGAGGRPVTKKSSFAIGNEEEEASLDPYDSDVDMGSLEGEDDMNMMEEGDEEMAQAVYLTQQQRVSANPQVNRWTSGIGSLGKAMQQQQSFGLGGSTHSHSISHSHTLKMKEETKQILGAPTLLKQLDSVFHDLEGMAVAAPGASAALPSSPLLDSPKRRVSLFGGKKGEKKRLIEKYKAQVQALEADRKVLAEKVRKASQTGGVALVMLKEEWAQAHLELVRKQRELEQAQEAVGKQEAETTQLRTAMSSLRLQLEDLKARAAVSPLRASAAPTSTLTAALTTTTTTTATTAAAPTVAQVLAVQSPETGSVGDYFSPSSGTAGPSPSSSSTIGSATSTPIVAAVTSQELVVKEQRLAALETELDLAYGKLEALNMQTNMSKDRSSNLVQQLQAELREVKAQLAARVKKYTEAKERVRQLEMGLELAAGQVEAVKHQMELRVAKVEDRLKESMKEALENERTAKNALFKRQQVEEEMERLREQYDVLVGQFEAIRSQVELEKMEANGMVVKYEKELEDVYGKLNAKDEYAGLLNGVKKDMDTEMTDLWAQVDLADEKRLKVEEAFVTLGTKYRQASARRLFNFMVAQQKRTLREAFMTMKQNAKEPVEH